MRFQIMMKERPTKCIFIVVLACLKFKENLSLFTVQYHFASSRWKQAVSFTPQPLSILTKLLPLLLGQAANWT
jgi:hypothetical protein